MINQNELLAVDIENSHLLYALSSLFWCDPPGGELRYYANMVNDRERSSFAAHIAFSCCG